MNIVMFTNSFPPEEGGVARSVETSVKDLKALGHPVRVVCPLSEDRPVSKNNEVFRLSSIQHRNGSDFRQSLPLPLAVEEALEAFAPDVIHSHHPFLTGEAAVRESRKHGVPLVFTFHTRYEKHPGYVPSGNSAMARFAEALETEYANLCDLVIAPSRSAAAVLRERGVTAPVEVVPTGVDVDFFARGERAAFRRERGIPEKARVLGYSGRLTPRKNLDYLALAAALAMERKKNLFFLALGTGPWEEPLKRFFQDRGLSQRLVLTGELAGPDLAGAYQAMDLFAFASRNETEGLAATEAMASGKPVIALDAPGVREVVVDGKNGRLLPSQASPEEFARAVLETFETRRYLRRFPRHAIKTAKRFSRGAGGKKLAALYREVVEKNRIRPAGKNRNLERWRTFARALGAEWELMEKKAESGRSRKTEGNPAGAAS